MLWFTGMVDLKTNYFVSFAKEGALHPLRSGGTLARPGDTLIDYIKGQVILADGNSVALFKSLKGLGLDFFRSFQIWADTHVRMGVFYQGLEQAEIGFLRGGGLTYTRVPDIKFDQLVIRELAMPAVVNIVAGSGPEPPLQTEGHPLFVNRFGDSFVGVTATQDTFSALDRDPDTFPNNDAIEFRALVSSNIAPRGQGRLKIHTSHVGTHSWVIKNTGSANGLTYRVIYNQVEGQDFAIDDSIGTNNVAFGAVTGVQSTRKAHRIALQVRSQTAGSSTTVAAQYMGYSV